MRGLLAVEAELEVTLLSRGEAIPRGGLVAVREGGVGGNEKEPSESATEREFEIEAEGLDEMADWGSRGEAVGCPVRGCEADLGVVGMEARTGGATEGICTRRAWLIEARAESLLDETGSSAVAQEVPSDGDESLLTARIAPEAAGPRVAAVLGESEGRGAAC